VRDTDPAVNDHRQTVPGAAWKPAAATAKRSDSSLLLLIWVLIWIRNLCWPTGRPACRRPQDASVAERLPSHPLDRDTAQVGVQHPERATVGHDGDLPGPVRPPWCGPVTTAPVSRARRRTRHPPVELAQGLPRPPGARRARPPGRRATRWPPGRWPRWRRPPARPGTARRSRGVPGHGQPGHLRERCGGLQGTAQVAGEQRADRPVPQPGRDGPGLALAQPGQPGLVAVPLGQPEGVPGALAVPDEPENLRAPDHDGLECRLFVKDQLKLQAPVASCQHLLSLD